MSPVAAAYSHAVIESPVISTVIPEIAVAEAKVPEPPVKDAQKVKTAAQDDLSPKERDGIIKQLNKTLEAFDTHVSLSIDEKSHQTIIKVIDTESGKVVRQIPSEQLMRVSERITELLGVIYDEKM